MKNVILLVAVSFLLFACGGDKKKNKSEETELSNRVDYKSLQGTWRSDGYHRIIEITDQFILTYEFSHSHCLLVKGENIDEAIMNTPYVLTNKNKNRFATDSELSLIQYHSYFYDRMPEIPSVCLDGGTEETDDPVVNFQALWDLFNEQYAFFTLREVNWQDVYSENLIKAEQIRDTGEGNFSDIIQDILPLFNDGHVAFTDDDDNEYESLADDSGIPEQRLREEFLANHSEIELLQDFQNDPNGFDDFEDYTEARYESFFDETINEHNENINGYLQAPLKTSANNQMGWGIIKEGNIGYLSIREMLFFVPEDEFEAIIAENILAPNLLEIVAASQLEALEIALDQAMNDLQNTDRLRLYIINGGHWHLLN